MYEYIALQVPKIAIYYEKIRKENQSITHKETTFPSKHSTPNHRHGSSAPRSQSNRVPYGSNSTLSLNLNRALPKITTTQQKIQRKKKNSIQSINPSQKKHTFIIDRSAQIQQQQQYQALQKLKLPHLLLSDSDGGKGNFGNGGKKFELEVRNGVQKIGEFPEGFRTRGGEGTRRRW